MSMLRILFALVWLAGLLPGMAQAADADTFVAASRSQQALLLEQWAGAPDPARLPLLQSLQQENLYVDAGKHAFARSGETYTALGASPAPRGRRSRCASPTGCAALPPSRWLPINW